MKNCVLRYGLMGWTLATGFIVGILLYLNVQIHPIPDSQFFFSMSPTHSLSEWIRIGQYYIVGTGNYFLPFIIFLSFNAGLPLIYLIQVGLKERGVDTHLPFVMMGITFFSSLPPYETTPLPRFVFWFVSMLFLSVVIAEFTKPITKYSYSL